MRHARQGRVVDALTFEHRGDVVAAGNIHQPPALQVGDRADPGAVRHQDDGRGVLKDHAEDDIVGAFGAV